MPQTAKFGKGLKYVIFLVVMANLALAAYVFLGASSSSSEPKPTPMPNPNGFDDFVKAAPMLHGNLADQRQINKMGREELAGLVADNEQALKLLETGISRECRVSEASFRQQNGMNVFPLLASWRQAASLFHAEGRLAELEGRTNDAIQFYLEGIRFGEKSGQGGVLIEKLIGVACEAAAADPLEKMLESLDAKQCAAIARDLEAIDSNEETDKDLLEHEDFFARKYSTFGQRFAVLLRGKKLRDDRNKPLSRIHAWTVHRRQLMLAFAARAYELEKGTPPTNAADLMPDYLKKVPQDPVTGTNLVHRP